MRDIVLVMGGCAAGIFVTIFVLSLCVAARRGTEGIEPCDLEKKT